MVSINLVPSELWTWLKYSIQQLFVAGPSMESVGKITLIYIYIYIYNTDEDNTEENG